LVVQKDRLDTGLAQVVVATISSQMFRSGHPSRVTVQRVSPQGRQSGLLTDSVVMTDNLATMIESALGRVIGSLPMGDVDEALRQTLSL
jgi:mRNA interferase MazF